MTRKKEANIYERYLHTTSSLVSGLSDERMPSMTPLSRHRLEVNRTTCGQVFVDMLLLAVMDVISLDKHLEM